MNKGELIEAISVKAEISKKDASKALEAICDSISETLTQGDKISLIGFGTFETRQRASRKGRNPQTGQEVIIPAKKAPVFKASRTLKEAVN